jgi:hypothetical protein
MKHNWSAFALALLFSLASMPVQADDNNSAKPNDGQSVEVYKQGDKYVVAVFQTDGSAVVSLVEASRVKRHGKGDSSEPDMDDLVRKGVVKYSVRLAPTGTAAAKALELDKLKSSAPSTHRRAPTRKERIELAKEARQNGQALQAIAKGLEQMENSEPSKQKTK